MSVFFHKSPEFNPFELKLIAPCQHHGINLTVQEMLQIILTPCSRLLFLALKDRPPPIIRQGPSNQTQALGGAALLRCLASGDPEPTVTWRKNGASLLGKDPRFSLLEHGSLQIQGTKVGCNESLRNKQKTQQSFNSFDL